MLNKRIICTGTTFLPQYYNEQGVWSYYKNMPCFTTLEKAREYILEPEACRWEVVWEGSDAPTN